MNKPLTIPEKWQKLMLCDFGEIVGGGTPSRTNSNYWGGQIPWITPGEITKLKNKVTIQV